MSYESQPFITVYYLYIITRDLFQFINFDFCVWFFGIRYDKSLKNFPIADLQQIFEELALVLKNLYQLNNAT